jgi:hypothetical protein
MKNIMLFHKKVAVLLLVAGAFLMPTSCKKDLLDQAPLNNLSDKTIFATPDRFLSLINGIYDQVKSGQFYGGRFIVYGDIRAEEFLNETGNGVTGLQTWNHTVVESSNEVNNVWNAAYACINSCNIFIEGADANRAVVGNDALVDQYIAEARFVRALCYHSLLRMYCRPYADGNGSALGVPLRIRAETGPGNNDLARATVAEVTAQILDDLNAAETNLAATNGSGILNVTRAHKNAAIALKTRVYLGMQRYGDVITEGNKLVPASAPYKAASGVAHELQANPKSAFTTPYTTTESIFSMPFTTNDLPGVQNGLGSYYNPGPRGIGDFSLNPAGIIDDSVNFAGTDTRRQFVLIHTNAKPYLNKFPAGPEHLDYAPVLRYAEVLLNLAEAEARTNGVTQRAVDLLNAVHGRSNPAVVYTTADFASGDALASALLTERRIELLGEGFRAFDCQRLLVDIPGKANVAAIQPSVSDYIWKIPSGELAVNKACIQNP